MLQGPLLSRAINLSEVVGATIDCRVVAAWKDRIKRDALKVIGSSTYSRKIGAAAVAQSAVTSVPGRIRIRSMRRPSAR